MAEKAKAYEASVSN